MVRSDEQLAYYVAQAREVIDLSMLSQKQIIEDMQQLASPRAPAGTEIGMSDDMDGEAGIAAPIWAAFGDLMSVLLGAFVLILVGVIGVQLQLSSRLDEEVKQRQAEAQRRRRWSRRWRYRWRRAA